MPGFDIEYPLAGATVGPSTHAGGEYDLTGLFEKRKPLTNEFKIRCEVRAADDSSIGHTPVWTGALAIDQVFWDVALGLTATHEGCKLTGELWEVSGGTTTPVTKHDTQVVENLSARTANLVDVIVLELP